MYDVITNKRIKVNTMDVSKEDIDEEDAYHGVTSTSTASANTTSRDSPQRNKIKERVAISPSKDQEKEQFFE